MSRRKKGTSVKDVAARARRDDFKARARRSRDSANSPTADSFVNFQQNLGIGSDNPTSTAGYGFNPISRIRTMLEWIHRGSWVGGVAVDVVADDMTRSGVELNGITPEDAAQLDAAITTMGVWSQLNETIKWSRLYGGCIAVMLVDGQDVSTPLRIETVRKGQFKGLLVLDRWMVEPNLEDLVQDYGKHLGMPSSYRVTSNAPALRGQRIHYTRCIRLEGIRLPYWQRLQENMWGISVLERLYDRMVAFDSATTGAAQLVYKSYLRTLKIDGLREVVAEGGPMMDGLTKYVDMMRRFQGIEGVTMIDGDDDFQEGGTSAFSGLADALQQFGQQLAGALQVPITRLFGQSPGGLDSSGDSDLRTYYDGIRMQQERDLGDGVTTIYRCAAASEGIQLKEGFEVEFRSLYELNDVEKAQVAGNISTAVGAAFENGIISRGTALRELRKSSEATGYFDSITDEEIESADSGTEMPPGIEALNGLPGGSIGAGGEEDEPADSPALEAAGMDDPTQDDAPEQNQRPPLAGPEHVSALSAVAALKRVHNLDVVLEQVRGEIRKGGAGRSAWAVPMADHYGYFRQTTGADGDQLDCYIGPHPESERVWVIDTRDPMTGLFDEHKVMLGYDTEAQALKTFAEGYTDGSVLRRMGTITEMPMPEFQAWLSTGQFQRPLSDNFKVGRGVSR